MYTIPSREHTNLLYPIAGGDHFEDHSSSTSSGKADSPLDSLALRPTTSGLSLTMRVNYSLRTQRAIARIRSYMSFLKQILKFPSQLKNLTMKQL